ncbi:hypothetical protein R1sor_005462 [Riccia sorocarpa]|uniref:Uncharacterized protein n=1 Tax=Riccia sorocarpa TaxID=122646 RepID=A0ABD3HNX8_9MARC
MIGTAKILMTVQEMELTQKYNTALQKREALSSEEGQTMHCNAEFALQIRNCAAIYLELMGGLILHSSLRCLRVEDGTKISKLWWSAIRSFLEVPHGLDVHGGSGFYESVTRVLDRELERDPAVERQGVTVSVVIYS